MIERKWKPENHKLEDAFFPVELCDLKFVYPAETDLFGKVVRTKDVLAKGHKAVVDINKCKAGIQHDELSWCRCNRGRDMVRFPHGSIGEIERMRT
jgi:hypothetical protein